jgi:plastocyanin
MKGVAMKKLVGALAAAVVAGVALAAVASAGSAPGHSTILIRHQMRGCHTWAVNRGPFRASLSTTLARGGTITFTNNDVMPHKLVLKSGPAVRFVGKRAMSHMGASVKVVFSKAGVYRFATKAGEDYPSMEGMKTIGEDNVLRLTVKVA